MFSELTFGGIPPPQETITRDLSFNESINFFVTFSTSSGLAAANTSLGGIFPNIVTLLFVISFNSLRSTSNPILKRFTPISGRYGAETIQGASLCKNFIDTSLLYNSLK